LTIYKGLASSFAWWSTVSPLVERILDSAGQGAFALVNGPPAVNDVRQDGTLRRVGLKQFLSAGTVTIDTRSLSTAWEQHGKTDSSGSRLTPNWWRPAVSFSLPWTRWRFLEGNDIYLNSLDAKQRAVEVGASVLVETAPRTWVGKGFSHKRLEGSSSLYRDEITLVLPHTARTEEIARDYCEWVKKGRPDDYFQAQELREELERIRSETVEQRLERIRSDTPTQARRFAVLYHGFPIAQSADFEVTGLVRDGEWRDPGYLEAARKLLVSRYDLKLGIWDLTDNETLRH